jgi:hypothetical protein
MRVSYRSRWAKHPAGEVVYEETDVEYCCPTMRRCWGVLIGFGVRGHLRSTSRDVAIFTTHPQANGKIVQGIMPVEFCPFCGQTIETCRDK